MQFLQFIQDNPLILIPLIIWSLCWKGFALWRAGRNNELPWFIALLVINTLGLLEIVYLAFFQKKEERTGEVPQI